MNWSLKPIVWFRTRKKKGILSMDLSIFATPEAWISLLTLLFLEIVLGVDNLVFISITTERW